MKEYIVPLNDTAKDWDEMFIAVIRKQEELIRCKDCVHYTGLTASGAWGRCHAHGRTCQDCDYCSWAERKEE